MAMPSIPEIAWKAAIAKIVPAKGRKLDKMDAFCAGR